MERVLSSLLQEPIKIASAGRTDAGVHASGQVISFSTSRSFPFERLAIACNTALAEDVSVRDVAIVHSNFSARFSARSRTYMYALLHRKDRSALLAHRAYHVYRKLDVNAMREGAAHLIGEHDFRSFCGMLPEGGITIRTVQSLQIVESGEYVRVQISGDGFLHRMVRTIVGTLIECGVGRRDPATMPAILAAKARAAAGLTAPAHGLYLAGVKYEDGYDSYAEPPVFSWSSR